jgi:parvulin-like peptidyl-prolyl isomerase
MPSFPKRTAAIIFSVLLAVLVALIAATMGIGKPSLPDGAVAFVDGVDDGEVTQEEFDAAIERSAQGQGGGQAPEPGTPQFNAAKVPAVSDLLLERWVQGEAEERGIEITEREIDAELDTIISEQFGGQKEFERFLDQSGFSDEEARQRVELQLMTQCIQDQVIPQDPEAEAPAAEREGCQGDEELEITSDDIQAFYDENIEQFETPETRDVRLLLNEDEAKVEQALEQLGSDPDEKTWEDVTAKLSTDDATKDLGGLRPGVAEGQNEPALDEAIFSASEGEVVGPVETEAGFYVLEVEKINAAETQELDEETSDQIRQQLVTQRQQEAISAFQDAFVAKWRARTVCSEDLLNGDEDGSIETQLAERCSNFSVTDDGCLGDDKDDELAPDPVTGEVPEEPEGCGAFVPSSPVVPPLPPPDGESAQTGIVQPTTGSPTALPQGPQTAVEDEPLPEGATPLGVPGAPTAPGAPPTGAPPTGAPPTGAPPTGASPTGAPPTGAPQAPPGG